MPDLFPIRMTKIGTTRDNYRPQALIAYESQIAWVGDLLPLLVAGGAAPLEDLLSVFDIGFNIACCGRRVRRHLDRSVVLVSPARTHAGNEHINLLRSQEATSRLSKGRHLCPRHAGRDPAFQ